MLLAGLPDLLRTQRSRFASLPEVEMVQETE